MRNFVMDAKAIWKMGLHSNIGDFSLIMTKLTKDQAFHLDILGHDKMRQYVMLLSDGCSTTKVCCLDTANNVKNMSDVVRLLCEGAKSHASWLEPSMELKEKMEKIDDKEILKMWKDGKGELFRISEGSEGENASPFFHAKSKHICDAPAGTIGGLHGNVIHAGSGVAEGDTRNVLFWTYSEKSKYDGNTQHTKVTVVRQLIEVLWKSSDSRSRLDLLKLLYYCFSTVNVSYQKTCTGTFVSFPIMVELLKSLNKQNQKQVDDEQRETDVLTLLKSYCRHDDFFKNNTQDQDRDKRHERREKEKFLT